MSHKTSLSASIHGLSESDAYGRMRRLMSVIASGRVDFSAMVTHRFKLEQIGAAYELFATQRDGVLEVAIIP